jgi:hypothetical protein
MIQELGVPTANSSRIAFGNAASRATVLATALALTMIGRALAVDIPINLGSPGTLETDDSVSFSDLNETPLSHQSLLLDFVFSGNQFVRLFTTTDASFSILLTLQTNGSGDLGSNLHGTGFLFDKGRSALHSTQDLGSASSDDASLSVGLFPFFSGELNTPLDFFGVHFDLTLPNLTPANPSLVVTGGEFELIASGINGDDVFGVGPGVPRDIVPDGGQTMLLLGIAFLGLGGLRHRHFHSR